VVQQRLGVEEDAGMAAGVGRGACSVDDDRVGGTTLARIVAVAGVVDLLPLKPPPLELGGESGGPFWMLVEDADGALRACGI
jgi:hypothetical protein